MYIVKFYNQKFCIYVKGCEDLRPVMSFSDEELADKVCDALNTSYDIGYRHGAELGY